MEYNVVYNGMLYRHENKLQPNTISCMTNNIKLNVGAGGTEEHV